MVGHSDSVNSVALSTNGKFIASGSADRTIKVWNLYENSSAFRLRLKADLGEQAIKADEGYLLGLSKYQTTVFGPQFLFDPYYQHRECFYNAIRAIRSKKYSMLSPNSLNVCVSEYLYTTTHFLAAENQSNVISALSSAVYLKTDVFGKSPIFYSLSSKNQETTDALMNLVARIEDTSSQQFLVSAFSIRNDFGMIIQNSSKYLPNLLIKLLVSSSYLYIDSAGPFKSPQILFLPKIRDFTLEKQGEISPVEDLVFPIPICDSGEETIKFLDNLLECKNNEAFLKNIIQHFIDLQWRKTYKKD